MFINNIIVNINMFLRFIRSILKNIYFVGLMLFLAVLLFNGIPKCQRTFTFQFYQKNTLNYLGGFGGVKKTQCKYTEMPYFTPFLQNIFTKKMEYSIVNTIYSIYLCDDYQHLGHEIYCSKNTCILSKYFQEINHRFSQTSVKYIELFAYIYANNLQTDVQTIKNDVEICYNNVIFPLIWIPFLGSVVYYLFSFVCVKI
jgi:hypothetical protein